MPITILIIDHQHKEMDAVATGPIRYAEVEKHLVEERNFRALAYKEFIDARDAALVFALSPEELRQIVGLIRALGQQSTLGPTAILVGSDFAFGVMRAMEMLLEDVAEIKPFREEEEAHQWLASRRDA